MNYFGHNRLKFGTNFVFLSIIKNVHFQNLSPILENLQNDTRTASVNNFRKQKSRRFNFGRHRASRIAEEIGFLTNILKSLNSSQASFIHLRRMHISNY